MAAFFLYNSEYETLPSFLGDNVEDLLKQAYDLGMDHLFVRDDEGVESWYILKYDNKLGVYPQLIGSRRFEDGHCVQLFPFTRG